ncbi:MAG TPA: Rrf2 family transcriptional regulator [Polyangiaceae bacterium]
MNRDSRLSVALHVLLHMREMDGPVTSETLGSMMDTNPVVIRRTLGGLREAGIVAADKGRGGGWSLAADLAKVSLADVYESLGVANTFGIGLREEAPRCPLERGVNRVVGDALAGAEAHLMERFRSVNVADLLETARKEKNDHARRHHRGR